MGSYELSFRDAHHVTDIEFGRALHHSTYRDVVLRQFGVWDQPVQDKYFLEGWNRAPNKIILLNGIEIGVYSFAEFPDHIFLYELQIRPEHQRKGLGTQILKEQMRAAAGKGLPLRLQVLRENRAHALYQRLGFAVTNTTDTHFIMEWRRADS